MPDATPIIVITPAELTALVVSAVREAVADVLAATPSAVEPEAAVFDYTTAATFTGLSESSLRRAVQRGDLRPMFTGCRSVRFSKAELLRFLEVPKQVA